MKKKVPLIILVAVLCVLAGAALLFLPGKNTSTNKLKVVAAENVWGDLAAQIGGDDVNVTSVITDPSADPHLYETSVQNAAAVAQADVVIVNGLSYDDFMAKLLSASPNQNRTVINIAEVLHASPNANPHLWYDLARLDQTTAAIQTVFNARRPDAAQRFAANTAKLSDALKPMFNSAADIKNRYSGTPVAYTERLPGYLLPILGLDNRTPGNFATAIEDGTEPSPSDQTAMQDLIATKQVRLLFYNAQAGSPVTESVRADAQRSGVPVVALTEMLPANTSYQTWMQSQLDAIRAALDNTK